MTSAQNLNPRQTPTHATPDQVIYAASLDGHVPGFCGTLDEATCPSPTPTPTTARTLTLTRHEATATPNTALVIQMVWSCLLIMSGSLEEAV